MSREAKKNFFFFCSEAEKNLFATILMGRSGNRKQDIILGLMEVPLQYMYMYLFGNNNIEFSRSFQSSSNAIT